MSTWDCEICLFRVVMVVGVPVAECDWIDDSVHRAAPEDFLQFKLIWLILLLDVNQVAVGACGSQLLSIRWKLQKVQSVVVPFCHNNIFHVFAVNVDFDYANRAFVRATRESNELVLLVETHGNAAWWTVGGFLEFEYLQILERLYKYFHVTLNYDLLLGNSDGLHLGSEKNFPINVLPLIVLQDDFVVGLLGVDASPDYSQNVGAELQLDVADAPLAQIVFERVVKWFTVENWLTVCCPNCK